MSKKQTKGENVQDKMVTSIRPTKRSTSMIEPDETSDIWMEFDRVFDRFRRDFERALMPHERVLGHALPNVTDIDTSTPYIDLEDKGNEFVLSAEAPGFTKDEIEINICGKSIEISGCKETNVDEKNRNYVRKERMSESFYRTLTLPEEIKYEEVSADLKNGVLEIVLPKKSPQQRRRIQIKQV